MKKILSILAITLFISCSSDDGASCSDKRADINANFDEQIAWVEANTDPVNQNQIDNLNAEREIRLDEACD